MLILNIQKSVHDNFIWTWLIKKKKSFVQIIDSVIEGRASKIVHRQIQTVNSECFSFNFMVTSILWNNEFPEAKHSPSSYLFFILVFSSHVILIYLFHQSFQWILRLIPPFTSLLLVQPTKSSKISFRSLLKWNW